MDSRQATQTARLGVQLSHKAKGVKVLPIIPFSPALHVAIRPSKGKGLGVFATRRYRAGELIESAPALLVPKDQVDALAGTFLGHYLFTTDNKKHQVIGLGITSMINHDGDANAEFFATIDRVAVKAKRAIPMGAEVTINYAWSMEEWALIGVESP